MRYIPILHEECFYYISKTCTNKKKGRKVILETTQKIEKEECDQLFRTEGISAFFFFPNSDILQEETADTSRDQGTELIRLYCIP